VFICKLFPFARSIWFSLNTNKIFIFVILVQLKKIFFRSSSSSDYWRRCVLSSPFAFHIFWLLLCKLHSIVNAWWWQTRNMRKEDAFTNAPQHACNATYSLSVIAYHPALIHAMGLFGAHTDHCTVVVCMKWNYGDNGIIINSHILMIWP
jgi:hypothetical protein